MKILFATSEIFPYVKTGGLGDVCAALPPELMKQGADVRLFLPGYDEIISHLEKPKEIASFRNYFGAAIGRLLHGKLGEIECYALDIPAFYKGRHPYVDQNNMDWPDNHQRFAAFCHAIAHLDLHDKKWKADIIHGHDWQAGLIPAYLKARGASTPKFILTIHNIAYQGLFPGSVFPSLKPPDIFFAAEGVEFYGKVGFLKSGLYYADHVTTVSPTYAIEIQNSDLGCGLQELLRHRQNDLSGILNGMDSDIWCPKHDTMIWHSYSSRSLGGKAKNRKAILKEYNLEVEDDKPLFGIVSRLTPQKGLDLVLACAPHILEQGCGFLVLGSGDRDLEEAFFTLAQQWPKQVFMTSEYDEALAHKIQAGADALLMPSRAEPCGLVQMYALCYGTLPIVRQTGGLADTVTGFNSSHLGFEQATGFVFKSDDAVSLYRAAQAAIDLYRDQDSWKKLQKNAMKADFSWKGPAEKYLKLYEKLATSGGEGTNSNIVRLQASTK